MDVGLSTTATNNRKKTSNQKTAIDFTNPLKTSLLLLFKTIAGADRAFKNRFVSIAANSSGVSIPIRRHNVTDNNEIRVYRAETVRDESDFDPE